MWREEKTKQTYWVKKHTIARNAITALGRIQTFLKTNDQQFQEQALLAPARLSSKVKLVKKKTKYPTIWRL